MAGPRRRVRRLWTAAGALSLALHVGALLFLLWVPPQKTHRPDTAITVEVRTPVAEAPSRVAMPEPVAKPTAPSRVRPAKSHAAKKEIARASGDEAAVAAITEAPNTTAAPPDGGKSNTADLLRMRRGQPSDLSLGSADASRVLGIDADHPGAGPGAGVRVDAAGRVLHGPRHSILEGARVQQALAQERQTREKGDVHPQMYDYARDARAVWKPDVSFMESVAGKPGYGETMADQWKPADRGTSIKTLSALVCLTVAAGAEPEVTVRTTSHNKRFDDLAVDSLQKAARRRPANDPLVPATGNVAPDSVVHGCYSFTASLRRVPPSLGSILAGGFEETTGEVGLVYWFKEILNLAVHLETIRYDRPKP